MFIKKFTCLLILIVIILSNFFIHVCCVRYHVPRSWLKPSKNLLVIFEEIGGDVSRISLVKRSVTNVCAKASDKWQAKSTGEQEEPNISLHCTTGYSISAIKFASFGTPSGSCGNFQHGTCHAPSSLAILEKVLRLKRYLSITPKDTQKKKEKRS